MRIALINENSQAAKNSTILQALKQAAEPYGHTVINYGMTSETDAPLTYVQNGILASILLESKAADFVITGCGTGEGAMLACNAMPGVLCGHITTPLEAWLFMQVNAGNAVSLPFAEGYGWGGELNLQFIFEKLFDTPAGGGYPADRAEPEKRNRNILAGVEKAAKKDLLSVLQQLDPELVSGIVLRPSFQKQFYQDAQDIVLKTQIRRLAESLCC